MSWGGRSLPTRCQRGERMSGMSEKGNGAEPSGTRVTVCREVALHLKHEFSEVSRTRKAVREALRGWGVEAVDDLVLLASELVTNALWHGADPVTVLLRIRDEVVHLEVRDASPAEPKLCELNPSRASGRGLRLVHALSDEWGWRRSGTGKVVWCKRAGERVPRVAREMTGDRTVPPGQDQLARPTHNAHSACPTTVGKTAQASRSPWKRLPDLSSEVAPSLYGTRMKPPSGPCRVLSAAPSLASPVTRSDLACGSASAAPDDRHEGRPLGPFLDEELASSAAVAPGHGQASWVRVLPACQAYDFEYAAMHLANPQLLKHAVALAAFRAPLVAIPVGEGRRGGFLRVDQPEVGEAYMAALAGRPGFPDLRLRTTCDGKTIVRWGAEPPQGSADAHAEFYGGMPAPGQGPSTRPGAGSWAASPLGRDTWSCACRSLPHSARPSSTTESAPSDGSAWEPR
ncbi:DUF6302 family protein [Streptomyces sp. NPDC053474]|uniref:DUF6302 family protein n=1 Tax=Streptomyces sp. NPDC053474 TaxID=3365704 RepID=UPI0037D10078